MTSNNARAAQSYTHSNFTSNLVLDLSAVSLEVSFLDVTLGNPCGMRVEGGKNGLNFGFGT